MLENEVEYKIQPTILTIDRVEEIGVLTLTSHHFHWVGETNKLSGNLSGVISGELESRSYFTSKSTRKLSVKLADGFDLDTLELKIDGDADGFLESLKTCISKKVWENSRRVENHRAGRQFQVSSAGIGGLQRRQERAQRTTGKIAAEAFTDIEALMAKARDVVSIMERYKAQLAEDTKESDTEQMRDLLLNMGISSPVTRSSAGSLYHQELARQLSDFLSDGGRLKDAGGMMTLPDVYCIFNRARGLALISPDDLATAAKLLRTLGLPMSMRTFSSGVCVIQEATHDDAVMSQTLTQLANQHGSLTSIHVGSLLGIPIPLAKEHLLIAEQEQALCRDETVECVHFYPNKFDGFLQSES